MYASVNEAIIGSDNALLLIGPLGTNFSEIIIKIHLFHARKFIWKGLLQNGDHFVSASMHRGLVRSVGCLNIKMSSHQFRDPHVKDKTVSRPSYF